jgi:hypothetical protein
MPATSRRRSDTLIRLVLDYRHRQPWTGLADAPAEVRETLDELARRTGWKPPAKPRTPAPPPRPKPPRSRPVPEWATDLIRQVCEDERRRPPKVTWYERGEAWSSGVTYKAEGRVHVTAGCEEIDAQLVLLHELAHWLAPATWGHNRRFWELAWRLYGTYLPEHLPQILEREASTFSKARTYCPFPLKAGCVTS